MAQERAVSEAAPVPERRFRRRWMLAAGAVVVAVVGLLLWRYYAVRESTDDAQIDGHIHSVAARVGGTVLAVFVEDNQQVAAGTPLVQIDPKDYEIALERAKADLADAVASAQAARTGVPLTSTTTASQVQTAESERGSARARLASAQAHVRETEAKDKKAAQDLERLQRLVAKDEVSRQEYDGTAVAAESARAEDESALAGLREAQEAVAVAEAKLAQARTAPQQVAIMQAHVSSAEAKVQQARAAVERAQLDLDHASVRAAVTGIVSKRAVEVGQVVQQGQPLLAVVPLEELWVTANFKEGQLGRMRPGQAVSIAVDAYRGRVYQGHVESMAPATGAKFSLLPAENASGNYVKVVQRVPVKIVFEKGQDPDHLLRPGMSVVPTVMTR
jgi:membrane fusion protein (multidrug efflux system)